MSNNSPVRRRLDRFSPDDAEFLLVWLGQNPVGDNLALQILEDLEDLHKRENCSAAAILSSEWSRVEAEEMQPKEIARRLRNALQARLHPYRVAHEAGFDDLVKRLGLPAEARLKAPQNFEGKTFQLQIEFSDLEGLRETLQRLQSSIQQGPWREIWNF
ncbi:MAG: hypothetical protein K8R69_07325 [Deltaproteobacteria bacterium]|nr:hypothetical protein [Deltaproteobacteria bacterium]